MYSTLDVKGTSRAESAIVYQSTWGRARRSRSTHNNKWGGAP